MPPHATERSLSVNALKKRSAGKSITPVLSPNRLSEWWWESMAHSLKQGILGRAKDISLRFLTGHKLLASGEPGELEARLRRFDGVYRWFLFRAEPLFNETGNIVKWYGTNTDIDDRNWAEAVQPASAARRRSPAVTRRRRLSF